MRLGSHMTEEQKANISVGQNRPEVKAKRITSHMGQHAWNKGIPMTEEQKARDSAAHKGKPGNIPSEEGRVRISIARKGKPLSVEHRAKLSAAKKGQKQSAEMIVHRAAAMMGHATSPETRTKIGVANKGRVMSLEMRAKDSAAHWKGGKQVSGPKRSAKRRLLGFNQLNSWFSGSEAHHINPQDVIHMPKKLHNSIPHNQYTGKGMAQMNALAGQFLTEDWT